MEHMAQPELAAGLVVAIVAAAVFFGLAITVLITVLPFWKICTKAGFSGALSLLMLVPIANIILPFYLAFSDWPALKNKQP